MNESHPRSGGPPWVRYRREAEDILCEAGAAILHLPDFYGPHVSRQHPKWKGLPPAPTREPLAEPPPKSLII
jgi:hypothetical protein